MFLVVGDCSARRVRWKGLLHAYAMSFCAVCLLSLLTLASCDLLFPTVIIRVTNDLAVPVFRVSILDPDGKSVASSELMLSPRSTVDFEVPKGTYVVSFETSELQRQTSEAIDMSQVEYMDVSLTVLD